MRNKTVLITGATSGIGFYAAQALMSKGARRSMPALQRLFWPAFRRIQRRGSAEKAAHSSVFLASSPEAASVTGRYFESNAKPKRPSALALDAGDQERAWELASTLIAQAPTALARGPALKEEREPKR